MGSIKGTNDSGGLDECVPSKSVAWYKPDIGTIPAVAAELLEEYSRISHDDLNAHISKVRGQVWKIAPYPCVGGFKFLELNMSLSPTYGNVLSRLKGGDKLLDLGCCLGQDIRKLVYDGVPSENLYAIDINGGLIDAGHDLFLDRGTLLSTFFVADIFRQDSIEVAQLAGQVDIVFAGSFFHFFDWDQQLAVAKWVVGFLRERTDSMVFGHHLGNVHSGEYPYGLSPTGAIFKHDVASFEQLWRQVGEATGSNWHVAATLETMAPSGFSKEGKWGDPDGRLMRFCVRRRGK